jgi:hypothetical protein
VSEQFIARIRRAITAAEARPYTVAEILACGCEPEIQHCRHCDGLRQSNAKREEAQHILAAPENEKRLLAIIDRLQKRERLDGGTGLRGEAMGGD